MKTFEITTPVLKESVSLFRTATDGTMESAEARNAIAAGNGIIRAVGQAASRVLANAADPYAYWNKALALGNGRQLTREQSRTLSTTTEPRCGFYRKRNKGGADLPVAIWVEDGSFVAKAGDVMVNADDIWTWCCSWPISHELYLAVADRGEAWPDDVAAVTPAAGHNLPDDPHEAAKVEFEGEKEAAEGILRRPITTQDDADRAAVASKRLSDLHGKVDKLFRAEKDPIVAAGREVDERFRWREEPKLLSVRLKRAQDDFLREKDRQEQERQRKAREEAERIRREAEEAARAAQAAVAQDDDAAERAKAEADRLAAASAAADREAEARRVQAGRTGAKVSLRTFVDAEITDYDALVIALKDRPEMQDLVRSLANRAAKAGVELAGMKIRSEKRAA